jgi:hypothetical protein
MMRFAVRKVETVATTTVADESNSWKEAKPQCA